MSVPERAITAAALTPSLPSRLPTDFILFLLLEIVVSC
jgi:hypothetical protein